MSYEEVSRKPILSLRNADTWRATNTVAAHRVRTILKGHPGYFSLTAVVSIIGAIEAQPAREITRSAPQDLFRFANQRGF